MTTALLRRLVAALGLIAAATATSARADDRTVSFDHNWRFHGGDAPGADAANFDEAGWRKLDVPHDWMIEGVPGTDAKSMDGPFDRNSPGGDGNGYLNGGVGWYRKHFHSPPAGRHAEVEFDGVYMDAHVWLNGHDLGTHPYGYTGFAFDLTPHLTRDGTDNVIAVRCEVRQPCSRFYSGAGIYRHVWLTVTDPVHVEHWGTYVTSVVQGDVAVVTARTRVANDGPADVDLGLVSMLYDPAGKLVDRNSSKSRVTVGPGKSAELTQTYHVTTPALWSPSAPQLYRTTTFVRKPDGIVPDMVDAAFGIRTIEFTVDDGFHLNGKRVPIRGVCDHHDLGVLGAAVDTRAIERQLEILRGFGCNAIRTSHYPPAPELLDLCDRMGFLVMDEAFDEWKQSKTKFGYGRFFDDWSERDLVSMVRRDRNHPSVVIWSIGNEIPEQGAKDAEAMATRLAEIVRREDPTRPTTSAMNNPGAALKTGFAKPLGVFGVNYNIQAYTDARTRGHVPMIGTETASALSTRGEYGLAIDKAGAVTIRHQFDHLVSDYDVVRPNWGNLAQTSLMALQRDPWMAGEFVWTGFDYLGEPTPYDWPSRSSYFGIADLCGFPKDRFYLYQSQWTDRPMAHLLPHWNWPAEFRGKAIPVWCYSNADAVELSLNGKPLGPGTRRELHWEWSVPYEPGELKVVATKGGHPVATDTVQTVGPPAKLTLSADRPLGRGVDLSFVTVTVTDAQGRTCPTAHDTVDFALTGPATIAGLGDGDPTNHEPFQGKRHRVFNGLGLAVVRSAAGTGPVQLTATAAGLEAATITVNKE